LTSAILDAVDRKRAEKLQRDELEYLARLALRDRMTGLPNRKVLDDRLTMLIASGNRHSRQFAEKRGTDFAVLLMDITAFGNINDRFGHAVGDAALKGFADKLRQVSRKSDLFGRFGGDEFFYLIERAVSVDTTDSACSRLIDALAFSIELESVGLSLSCSIGAATYPLDGETATELIEAAERATQSAKSSGGGYRLATAARNLSPAAIADQSVDSEPAPLREIAGNPGQPITADAAAPDEEIDSHTGAHREKNRRGERRQRVLKRGIIVTNDGFSTIDCVIRDLSTGGARIAVNAEYSAHPQFLLLIAETGERFPAEKRWQRGRDIGVKFLA
jgi:diguanylate cyclase (GGDEF)-like protein